MRSDLRFCINKSMKKNRDKFNFTMHNMHHNDAENATKRVLVFFILLPSKSCLFP